MSLCALRRLSWLVCGVSGLCLLTWAVWRIHDALRVPPPLLMALQDAGQRGQGDIEQHLQQAHQVLNGLIPSTTAGPTVSAVRWVQDPALFAPVGLALTRITPDVRFVYFDNLRGAAHGVEQTADGVRFCGRDLLPPEEQVLASRSEIAPRNVLADGPLDAAMTSNPAADRPPWHATAQQSRVRVVSAAAWSTRREQLEVTVSQPVFGDSGELAGVAGTDLSLKPLNRVLARLKVSPGSLVYLVDADGRLLASTFEEPLVGVRAGQLQRQRAADSASAIVRASVNALGEATRVGANEAAAWADPPVRVEHAELPAGRFVGLRHRIHGPSGPAWQLVLLAPERDFRSPPGGVSDWLALCLALLTGGSLAAALVVWQLEQYFARAHHALKQSGLSAVSIANRTTPFTELQRFSAVLRRLSHSLPERSAALTPLNPPTADIPGRPDTAREAALRAELAAASELALTAVRSRAAFMAVISHEFRTPLNGATGMGALLADTRLTPVQRGYLDALMASSHRLQSVLDDIIDYCRVESGDVVLQPAPFNVRAMMDQACDDPGNLALSKGLDFSVDVAGSVRDTAGALRPWVVLGDVGHVGKVVTTLVHNAIKFTDTGSVRVVARYVLMDDAARTSALVVQVTDTGRGMTPAQLQHSFKPFTQGDSSISRQHSGIGLGLAICNRLAALMSGRLEADSEVGRGSVFRLIVPAPLIDAETAPGVLLAMDDVEAGLPGGAHAVPGASARPSRQGPPIPIPIPIPITVLVVDDNEINRKVACAMLGKFGYIVRTANGGRDAIDQVGRAHATGEKIDVVLMDVHMPGVDGIQAAQAIVKQLGSAAPPIIALTADVSGHYVQRCLGAGMVDYLTKPLQPWALAQSLLRWVGPGPTAGSAAPATPPSPGRPSSSSKSSTSNAPMRRSLLASAATEEAAMPRELVDLDRLNDFREFDDSQLTITHEVINLLFKEVPIKLDALERAVASDDVAALVSAAHSLRGVSGHVGAVVVQHLCGVLERGAVAEGRVPSDAGPSLVALHSAWRRTRPLLEAWR